MDFSDKLHLRLVIYKRLPKGEAVCHCETYWARVVILLT